MYAPEKHATSTIPALSDRRGHNVTVTSNDTNVSESQASEVGVVRSLKPWVTPEVIVSELRNAGAQVAVGSDGTDTRYSYQYGS